MARQTLPFLLLALLTVTSAARRWSLLEYPNPNVDLDWCGRRGVRSSICDPDLVLSYESANVVEDALNAIAADHGYQVAVALVEEMEAVRGMDKPANAEFWAKGLHDRWGVGDAATQKGVVLFLAKLDRRVHISTGAGAKAVLTDSETVATIDRMRSKLRAGDYDGAVEGAVEDLRAVIAGGSLNHSVWEWAYWEEVLCVWGPIVVVVVLLFVFVYVFVFINV